MLRDIRTQVSSVRRTFAIGLLVILLALGGVYLFMKPGPTHPWAVQGAVLLFWAVGIWAGVKVFAYLLLDPLLSNRRTAIPGFARDLVVAAVTSCAVMFMLHQAAGVNLGALLGTGALAAAVVGLSMQETLGNLFAGISLHLDDAFEVGDWIEVSGNLRGGPGRESFIGKVETMTWRSVQLVTENGDTDIFPNRAIAQAVVTNLYAPSGLHRRTTRIVVEPHQDLHAILAALELALGGLPHLPSHKPEVVAHSFDLGGVVLEIRWWTLGWRHGRAANYLAVRLAATVLPRLGVALLGPHGATTPHPRALAPDEPAVRRVLVQVGLPGTWAERMLGEIALKRAAPDEGVIRAGDPGDSLFFVLRGRLEVVRAEERTEPYSGLFWNVLAELGSGSWFGEASLLTGAPRNATVVARTDCELVEIPKLGFEQCLRQDPHVLESLVDLMECRAAAPAPGVKTDGGRELWTAQIKRWFGL